MQFCRIVSCFLGSFDEKSSRSDSELVKFKSIPSQTPLKNTNIKVLYFFGFGRIVFLIFGRETTVRPGNSVCIDLKLVFDVCYFSDVSVTPPNFLRYFQVSSTSVNKLL